MGDLNDDSIPDLVFGNYYYQTYAYSLTGDLFPGFPIFATNYEYRSSSIGKLSSSMCIMAMGGVQDTTNLDYLRSYNNLGTQLPWSPLRPRGIPVSAVTFGDINNDHQVDFLIPTFGILPGGDNTGLYAWTMPGINFTKDNFPWPMYCHDRYRTNQYQFVPPDEPVGIRPISSTVPDKFNLYQNYPNPFNPTTTIKFDVTTSSFVKINIFDALGREMETLINERLKPGSYSFVFDGSKYSSGVYFYRLALDSYSETKKMLMVK